MSRHVSPFIDGGSGRRRDSRRVRRRHRRRQAAALLVLAGLAVAVAVALGAVAGGSATHREGHDPGRTAGASDLRLASPGPSTSVLGLPLAKRPLELIGLNEPLKHPLPVFFTQPPRAGLLLNLQTGQVLWQLHPQLRMPIASLTKMMTALLVVKSTREHTMVRITKAAVQAPGSRVGVLPLGKNVPLKALMYGLLLPSGNDAATALAEHVAGTLRHFVSEMNAEAAALGLGCTRYSNPSGYYDHNNFSCAADLGELAAIDIAQPRIAQVVRSASAVVPFPIKGGRLFLYNNNPLLVYGYRGATGMKTGYTEAAGTCLVATASRHGVRLGVVLLHSPAPGTQAQKLLDAAFHDVYHQQAVPEAEIPGGV